MTVNFALSAVMAGSNQQNLENSLQGTYSRIATAAGELISAASKILYAETDELPENQPGFPSSDPGTGSVSPPTPPPGLSAIGIDMWNMTFYAELLAQYPSSSGASSWSQQISLINAQYGADSATASNFVQNGQTNLVQPLTSSAQQASSAVSNVGSFVTMI